MIILDCSAAIAIVRKIPEGQALSQLVSDDEKIIAPNLFYAELGNSLFKYARAGEIEESKVGAAIRAAENLVDGFRSEEDFLTEAVAEAVRLNHSVYDMLYFVLARREAATLLTLDQKLQNLCLDNGVNCVRLDAKF